MAALVLAATLSTFGTTITHPNVSWRFQCKLPRRIASIDAQQTFHPQQDRLSDGRWNDLYSRRRDVGLATLSPREPFNEPTNPNRTTKRYLVLMTDGENTISPTYPYHDGSNTTTANNLTRDICTNIKADNIEVFSIAFR